MSYKLYYFPFRGRGEQVRLLLQALEQPFEDVRIRSASFGEMKKEGPRRLAFGSVPMLEDGELCLAQGPIIMSYLARKHGIYPASLADGARADSYALGAEDLRSRLYDTFGDGQDDKQAAFVAGDWASRWLPSLDGLLEMSGDPHHFVGSALSHADVAIWDALDQVCGRLPGASLDAHPRLGTFVAAFAALPAVARYLAERPEK
jgi:glutathione S-transferase